MQRILITGAAGRLGKVLRGGLARSDRILRLLDIADLGEAATNEELVAVDAGEIDLAGVGQVAEAVEATERRSNLT